MPDALLPGLVARAVEDDEVSLVDRAHQIHIGGGLLQPLDDGRLQVAPQNLQLQHHTLHRAGEAALEQLADEQVGASSPQAVLAVDVAPAVDHALQEGLQQQLRPGLGVVKAANPRVGVLAEELLKVEQQLLHIERVVGIDIPLRLVLHCLLCGPCEFARNDFTVYTIGNAQGLPQLFFD